jgi:hypothetical protein
LFTGAVGATGAWICFMSKKKSAKRERGHHYEGRRLKVTDFIPLVNLADFSANMFTETLYFYSTLKNFTKSSRDFVSDRRIFTTHFRVLPVSSSCDILLNM